MKIRNLKSEKMTEDFKKGDYVRFQTVGKDGLPIRHAINDKRYRITYVLCGWGLKNGYVAFGLEEAD